MSAHGTGPHTSRVGPDTLKVIRERFDISAKGVTDRIDEFSQSMIV